MVRGMAAHTEKNTETRRIYTSRRADRHDGYPGDFRTLSAPLAQMVRRHYRSMLRHGVPRRVARHTVMTLLHCGASSRWTAPTPDAEES